MPCYAIDGIGPVVDPTAHVHPSAVLIGDVIVGPGCYVGPCASLRGDFGWPPLLLAAALAGDGRPDEGREVLRQHRLREPQCDRANAEMLLGHGDVGYMQGRSRILSTLEGLGIADE